MSFFDKKGKLLSSDKLIKDAKVRETTNRVKNIIKVIEVALAQNDATLEEVEIIFDSMIRFYRLKAAKNYKIALNEQSEGEN